MARVLYGATISSINGSIGGTTFQRNRYGSTAKKKPATVIPNSDTQNRTKALMQFATTQWRNLTPAQRSAWNLWAETYPQPSRLNPAAYLNGFNLFVRHTMNYQFILPGSFVPLPAFNSDAVNNISLEVFANGSQLFCDISSTITGGNWSALCFVSGIVTLSQYVSSNPTRLVGTDGSLSAPVSSIDCTGAYLQQFGTIPDSPAPVIAELTIFSNDSPRQYVLTPRRYATL